MFVLICSFIFALAINILLILHIYPRPTDSGKYLDLGRIWMALGQIWMNIWKQTLDYLFIPYCNKIIDHHHNQEAATHLCSFCNSSWLVKRTDMLLATIKNLNCHLHIRLALWPRKNNKFSSDWSKQKNSEHFAIV